MERFDFSKGHIFIKNGGWSIFMNGSGNCGKSGSRSNAVKDILSHWKLSEQLKDELSLILSPEIRTGEQLELF